MDINQQNQYEKVNTLFVGIGAHSYDKLLSVIDNPLTYEALIKHNFRRIIFQCPHKDYFKPLFHKQYESKIKIEVYGIEFPSELFLYKSDVAITSCDVGVLLESHSVKINLIIVIEDTNSISYEIFTNLKEKPNVLGIKGAETITSELVIKFKFRLVLNQLNFQVLWLIANSQNLTVIFLLARERALQLSRQSFKIFQILFVQKQLDQYLTIKRDIQEVLRGGHRIPGEEYRPKKSDEKFQRQLMLLKQSLTDQNDKYKSQDRHYATEDENMKNNLQLHLDYLTFAFDSKKLNLTLVRHPQFQHLEPLLKKNDFFTFQKEIFNGIKIEDDGMDFQDDFQDNNHFGTEDFHRNGNGNGNFVNGGQSKSRSRNIKSNGEGILNKEENNDDEDAKSNNSFDSFNSNQVDSKIKRDNDLIGNRIEINEYTQPKSDENEEDYFLRIKKNYNPFFYLENQNLLDDEDEEDEEQSEEEVKDSDGKKQLPSEKDRKRSRNANNNKLGKSIKKSYLNKVAKNKKLYHLDFSNQDPLQMLRNQDPMRAQEVHIKKIEKTNNEIDELMSSIEKKEVIQMIKDEYEAKIIKGSYRICNCPYCKRLMVPFLVRKDFEDCHQEINDMVLNKHKLYFEKVMLKYQINDINIEYINNIFFREYKTNYISVTVEPDLNNQQANLSSPSSEANNDSPFKSKSNIHFHTKKGGKSSLNPSSILRNHGQEDYDNEIEVELDQEGKEEEEDDDDDDEDDFGNDGQMEYFNGSRMADD